jgi:hypothetical protein
MQTPRSTIASRPTPWNRGKLIVQKPPLKLKDIWAIRITLKVAQRPRDLALFNLALDSKLRGCDLLRLRVDDVALAGGVRSRATIVQRKTGLCSSRSPSMPGDAVERWIHRKGLRSGDFKLESTVRYLGI